ncbi:MAG: DUF4912 domain-containing protein, partial [Planctomycetota bacterium]|nr:DUF4912 domain-containing protein [Planctomycetota bacterium]
MPGNGLKTLTDINRNRREAISASLSRIVSVDARREIIRHFRDNFPILMDGTIGFRPDPSRLVRQARETLVRGGGPASPPAALLRETLDSIQSPPLPSTRAGLVAIGPRAARVWWDAKLLPLPGAGNLGDVFADLSRPRPILRFRDFTGLDPTAGRWNGVFDIDIDLAENGKTIDFWAADKSYVAEIGLLHSDGRFQRLAHTNPATLPREGKGAPAGQERVRTNLRPGRDAGAPVRLDEEEIYNWLMSRPDHPGRDFQAELVIHTLYRDYDGEGPRALRRAPRLSRRDAEILSGEYRDRLRAKKARPSPSAAGTLPRLLAERLDSSPAVPAAALSCPPVHAPASVPADRRLAVPAAIFGLLRGVLLWSAEKAGKNAAPEPPLAALPLPPAVAVSSRGDFPPAADEKPARGELVQILNRLPGDPDPITVLAEPVFAAARNLRLRLTALPAPRPSSWEDNRPASQCDGLESRRFAKAGARFIGLPLVLEARARPDASLKVAGRLVRADANGRFHLECVLTGRKTS